MEDIVREKSQLINPGQETLIQLPGWFQLVTHGVTLLGAAWASLKALERIRRKLFSVFPTLRKAEQWCEFNNVLELNDFIQQERFDKELESRIKKNANIVLVTGTLF